MGTQGAEVSTNRPAWGKENLTITEKKKPVSSEWVCKKCPAFRYLSVCACVCCSKNGKLSKFSQKRFGNGLLLRNGQLIAYCWDTEVRWMHLANGNTEMQICRVLNKTIVAKLLNSKCYKQSFGTLIVLLPLLLETTQNIPPKKHLSLS